MQNNAKIKFKFELGILPNGKQMQLSINGDKIPVDGLKNYEHEMEVQLPCNINLLFSGKDSNTDTIVSESGDILHDSYVKVNSITLDGHKFTNEIHKMIYLVTNSGDVVNSNYIGFNGVVNLELSEVSVFRQVMRWR